MSDAGPVEDRSAGGTLAAVRPLNGFRSASESRAAPGSVSAMNSWPNVASKQPPRTAARAASDRPRRLCPACPRQPGAWLGRGRTRGPR